MQLFRQLGLAKHCCWHSIIVGSLEWTIESMDTVAPRRDHAVIHTSTTLRIAFHAEIAIRIPTIDQTIPVVIHFIAAGRFDARIFTETKGILTVHQSVSIVVLLVVAILLRRNECGANWAGLLRYRLFCFPFGLKNRVCRVQDVTASRSTGVEASSAGRFSSGDSEHPNRFNPIAIRKRPRNRPWKAEKCGVSGFGIDF